MEPEPTHPAEHVVAVAEDNDDEEEAFIDPGDGGDLGPGFRVIDDLDDDAPAPISSDDDDDDDEAEIDDAGGADAGGSGGAYPGDSMTNGAEDSWHCFEGHTDGVMAVAWNPAQPRVVATGGIDDRAFLWQAGQEAYEAGADTHELDGHSETVTHVAFNAEGSMLATADMDGKAQVWDVKTGKVLQQLEGPGEAIEFMCWHPRGNVLLAGSEDTTVWMWLAATGACMQVFSGHGEPVTAGAFSPDGKLVVTAGYDGALKVWNPKTGECMHTLQGHPFHSAGITCLKVGPNSDVVLTADEDGGVRVANIQTGRVVGPLDGHPAEASVEAVGFCTGLPLAASVAIDGDMIIWDLQSMALRSRCKHGEALTCLAMHPTQPLVATGCVDGVVRAWDMRTAVQVATFRGHGDAIQALAFSADGAELMSGSDDHTARVFHMPSVQ